MSEFSSCKTPDMNEPWDGPGLPPGARAGLSAFAGAAVILMVPYVLATFFDPETKVGEAVAELRAWVPGDPVPFAKAFNLHGTGGVGEAGGGAIAAGNEGAAGAGAEAPLPDEPALVVEPIAVGIDEPDAKAAPASDAKVAASDAKAGAHHDAVAAHDARGEHGDAAVAAAEPDTAQAPTPPAPENLYARIHIPEETWTGLTTFIEDPSNSMATFYAKLADVALKRPGAKVRISHWGDSALAADGMTSAARRLLQRTFGDGGHGYAMLASANPWYMRKDVIWTASGWQAEEFIRDNAEDRRYGFGGVASVGYQGARASWQTVSDDKATSGKSASQFIIYYQAQKGGGALTVKVDGDDNRTIQTRSENGERSDEVVTITVPDGPHTFEVRNSGGGRTKVYGVALERDSGVVYDGMGVVGARDARWLNVDPDHLVRALGQRNPDLSILMYGGNALVDDTTMDWYRDHLTQVVNLWRKALPSKSCLLMSPIDHGERYRGRVRTVPRQLDLMKVQREVALAVGCAWFSIYDAMGGEGTIGAWLDQGLANGDLAHPTGKGSVALGALWYKALMKGFAEFLASHAQGTP
ncbi:MAG: hypothetical protein U1F43_19960 [Myxococcota bacterium]